MISLKTLKPLLKDRHIMVGTSLLLPPVLLGLFGPIVIELEAISMGSVAPDLPPSWAHLLGSDSLGRDVFAILLHSIGNSYLIGMLAGGISMFMGLTIGLISGYRGGIADDILANMTNIFMVIPTWPLLVTLAAYVRIITVEMMCLIIAVFGWTWSARTIRSQVMSLKERSFIDLARLSGLKDREIIFKEIVPNMLPYLGVNLITRISGSIATEVSLQIVGLGPQGFPTLGLMLHWAIVRGAIIKGMWWWVVPPIFCLAAIFIGMHLINMGLDQVFNPRLRRP